MVPPWCAQNFARELNMVVVTPYDEKLKPLIEAVRNGNLDYVRKWMESGEPIYNPKSRTSSVLEVASESGFFSMLELLLSVGGWEQYANTMNSALRDAVLYPHVDNARILLDHGADPNYVEWYSIFESHKRDLVTAFLEHNKDTSDIDSGIDEVEWGTARALRDWFEQDRSMEVPLLRKMIELIDEIYENSTWYIGRNDDYKQSEQQIAAAKHAERIFSLIRWIGVDVRRSIVVDEDDILCNGGRFRYGPTDGNVGLGRLDCRLGVWSFDLLLPNYRSRTHYQDVGIGLCPCNVGCYPLHLTT